MKTTMKTYIRENLTVPNVLTMLRMVMIPVYIVLFVKGFKYWALFMFLLAGFTDVLDGTIARKFNLITDFGKLMDPLADKLMGITALLSMTIGSEAIPPVVPWGVVLVILGKEILMVLGGVILYRRHIVVYSKPIGKAAQALLTAGLTAAYFHDNLAGIQMFSIPPDTLLLYAATALTLIALGIYASGCIKQLKELQEQ